MCFLERNVGQNSMQNETRVKNKDEEEKKKKAQRRKKAIIPCEQLEQLCSRSC